MRAQKTGGPWRAAMTERNAPVDDAGNERLNIASLGRTPACDVTPFTHLGYV
jgi:hypothetical protein